VSFLKIAKASADSLLKIINDVLDFSRWMRVKSPELD
jgi:hypothetical protein